MDFPSNLSNQSSVSQMQQAAGRLETLKQAYLQPSTKDQKKLKESAQQFEAVFIQQLLDVMDKTVDRNQSLFGNDSSESYWRGMFNEEVSKSIATRPGGSGFGLAESIYRQLSQNLEPASQDAASAPEAKTLPKVAR